ncbi:SHOCT domain-containing protein [Halovivax cerinus]|uniref:SHOCT domain-containing protein n=1 Tax=Halovivax cerinus TaxID=1487865 RepID=A0ABD5NSB8_9EURY|nr:SHOCT domain-containing protein [Halovivax cerinus]
MTQLTTTVGRTVRRASILAVSLAGTATGTVAAHGGGSYDGGMMGGGWGLFGGTMGLLWMGLLVAAVLYVGSSLLSLGSGRTDERSLSVLRDRYARGDLSEEEYERRRERLERAG